MIVEGNLTAVGSDWRSKIAELEALLEEIRPQLVTAEGELADRLAEISAFEFRLRVRLAPLTRRLEKVEAEIRTLRQKLRHLQDAWLFDDDWIEGYARRQDEWTFAERDAAREGAYRYREATDAPPATLSADEAESLKRLYRRLARRFHPDFALDEEDRARRTQLMMAINAAYAAGDLDRLEEIAAEPDRAPHAAYSDEELAAALWRELVHCRRRLQEVHEELARLEEHKSAQLMVREQTAAAEGRDLLAEMEKGLRAEVTQKLVQRDVLQAEIEAFLVGEADFAGEDLAETMYDLGLEEAFDDDSDAAFSAWRERQHGRFEADDGNDDEEWRAIRKASGRRKRK